VHDEREAGERALIFCSTSKMQDCLPLNLKRRASAMAAARQSAAVCFTKASASAGSSGRRCLPRP